MLVHLFPGQGSQSVGMGAGLFDRFPDWTSLADEILGYSVRQVCEQDPQSRLTQTEVTQPALFVVNALHERALIDDGGRLPDVTAGHSLGEFNALLVAGVFDFATGLRLVQRRGALMAEASGGGMAAVIGLTEDQVRRVLADNGLDAIDVANLNTPSQVVVSGLRADVERAQPAFTSAGAFMYSILKVSGAFHSRYMAPFQQRFAEFLAGFDLGAPRLPVVANATARPYTSEKLRETLVSQIASPVRWSDSIRYLMALGEPDFQQVGPGNTITGLVRAIRREAVPLPRADLVPLPAPTLAAAPVPAPIPVASQPMPAPAASMPKPTPTSPVAVATPAATGPGGEPSHPARGRRTDAPSAAREHQQAPQRAIVAAGSALGSAAFRRAYGARFACVIGGMGQGVGGAALVAAACRHGFPAFLGTFGRPLGAISNDIDRMRREVGDELWGVNVRFDALDPDWENRLLRLLIDADVRRVEASGYIAPTEALVRHRARGLGAGEQSPATRLLVKVTRPEVADAFLRPAPDRLVAGLVAGGLITRDQAEAVRRVPLATEMCVLADSAGPTDRGRSLTHFPALLACRDRAAVETGHVVPLGLGGGIGSPPAIAAALAMGADFVLTGSINQCSVEADTSDLVKDLLQRMNVQDTAYAPSGELFEYGAQVQVLKRGVLFPARAAKLYDLYRRFDSLDSLDAATTAQLEDRYFGRPLTEVSAQIRAHLSVADRDRFDANERWRMALVFSSYCRQAYTLAQQGHEDAQVDFQVYCSPALGAFNQWAAGSDLEDWRRRRVGDVNERLMDASAALMAAPAGLR